MGTAIAGNRQAEQHPSRNTIAWASLILTSAFLASRALGLVRQILLNIQFGTSPVADAYNAAFLIPDTIFNLLSGGSLASAFIPVFIEYLVDKRDEAAAWRIASIVLNVMVAALTLSAITGAIFAPQFVSLLTSHSHSQATRDLTISLTRIMLIQPVLLGIATIYASILNARQRFLLPAIGQVLYNVGIIAGVIVIIFFPHVGIYGPTYGVVAGAFLQVAIQLPDLVRTGLRYSFEWEATHPAVIRIGQLLLPRLFSSSILYLAFFVDRFLALSLGEGLLTALTNAWQLMLLPLGIFAMSIAAAAFPTMAEEAAMRDLERLQTTYLRVLRTILFLTIPASVGLMVLGRPIIMLLFQHGNFTAESTALTNWALLFYSIGLFGHAMVEITNRCFFALQDSRTPFIVGSCQLFLKIILSIVLLRWLAQGGIALGSSVGIILEAAILLVILRSRLGHFSWKPLSEFLMKTFAASFLMGIATYLLSHLISPHVHANQLGGEILVVGISILGAALVYLGITGLLKMEELPLERVIARIGGRLRWG